jgi:thiamine kinase-like enzyme
MRRDQESFLRALDRTPNTVCHFDLHPANLFGEDDETVLIDWSFVGIGALGEDAGNLVPDAVLDFHVAPEHIDELYDIVRSGYLDGSGRRAGPDRKRRSSYASHYRCKVHLDRSGDAPRCARWPRFFEQAANQRDVRVVGTRDSVSY